MERGSKRMFPLLLAIVLLAGALGVLYAHPELLSEWQPDDDEPVMEPEQPGEFQVPTEPEEPDEPEQPTEPTQPTVTIPQAPIVRLRNNAYTYANMRSDLVELAGYFPQILQVTTYGTSADGRELYMAKLGNPNAEKQIIVSAGMHAREYVNCYVVMKQLEHYLRYYETGLYNDVTYRQLFSEVCLILLPMTNPDGITLAQEGIEALRTAALKETVRSAVSTSTDSLDTYLNREWKSNARGVDINRNFDALWQQHADGVGRPSAKNYKGAQAASEPETQALVRVTEELSNPVASVCMHMQGEVIYWRCYQEGALETENRRLAELASEVTGYEILDSNETEPSYSNWTILAHGIPTITVETGVSRYPLSYSLADGILSKNMSLWAAVANEYYRN